MKRILSMAAAFALAAAAGVAASSPTLVVQGFARETLPGSSMSAAYLTLQNRGASARQLQRVELSQAEASAELHTTQSEGDMSRMRPLAQLEVPASGAVEMAPGGVHLMLHGLQLRAGEQLPLRLYFANGEVLEVRVPVRRLDAQAGHKHHHG